MTQLLIALLILAVLSELILTFSKDNNGVECPECKSNMEFVEYIESEKVDLYRCPKCNKVKRVSLL